VSSNYPYIVFMKVGLHAGEDFASIIQRKKQEIADTESAFWGYGGMVCHPLTQVRPFAQRVISTGAHPFLLMNVIKGRAGFPSKGAVRASEYTIDRKNWFAVPDGVCVTGSKNALVIEDLQEVCLDLSLIDYEVAVGPNKGRNAVCYLQGRTDKACLELTVDRKPGTPLHTISYVARLCEPWAVVLRS